MWPPEAGDCPKSPRSPTLATSDAPSVLTTRWKCVTLTKKACPKSASKSSGVAKGAAARLLSLLLNLNPKALPTLKKTFAFTVLREKTDGNIALIRTPLKRARRTRSAASAGTNVGTERARPT